MNIYVKKNFRSKYLDFISTYTQNTTGTIEKNYLVNVSVIMIELTIIYNTICDNH